MKKISNFELIFIIAAIIKILGLVYRLLLSRILTIEGMRIVSMILPTLTLMLSISSFSISTVVNQNCASNAESPKVILKSALNITLTTSSIISLVLLFSFPLYKAIYETSFIYFPLLLCIPLIYFSNISGIIKGYLEANNKHNISYISNIIEQIFKFFLTFGLLIIFKNQSLNCKIIITFLSLMLSEISSFTYLVLKLKKKYKIEDLRLKTTGYERNILKQATPLTLEQLLMTLTAYLEPLLFYYATNKLGIDLYQSTIYYTQITAYAIPLILLLKFGIISICKFAFPYITKSINTNISKNIVSNLLMIGLFSFALNMVIVWFYPETFLKFLYDDTSSITLLKPLSLFIGLSFFTPIFMITLQSYNKEKKIFYSTLISSSIFLISIIPLTLVLGIKGYIFSIILSYTLRFLLLFVSSYKYINITFSINEAIKILLIIIILIIPNFIFKNLIILVLSTLLYGVLILYLFYKKRKSITPVLK